MAKKQGQKHRHTQREQQRRYEQTMGTKRRGSAGEEPEKPPWWERDVSGKGKKQ